MPIFPGRHKYQSEEHGWIKQHSLGLTLALMLLVQTAYAVWSGVYVFSREEPFGPGVPTLGREFWAWWSWEYNISLVADTFGVFLIVMLSKWLYEQDSSESGDDAPSGEQDGPSPARAPANA